LLRFGTQLVLANVAVIVHMPDENTFGRMCDALHDLAKHAEKRQ